MIVLDRNEPIKLQMLEALLRRLPMNDPGFPIYSEKLRQVKAGYAGEKRVDMEWKELRYPGAYYLLHDAQFINEVGSTHQMDTIFICQNFALVVEVKNIKGRVDFDDVTHQCTRTNFNGEVEGFSSGVYQLLRHKEYLSTLFDKFGFVLPIEMVIIFAYPSTVIGTYSSKVRTFHIAGLREEMARLYKKYPTEVLDKKKLKKLAMKLSREHKLKVPQETIEKSKLTKGVLCANCEYRVRMFYRLGHWYCPSCQRKNNRAFYEALHDYRLLKSEVITNRVLREEFGVPSANVASKVLSTLKFESRGGNKNRAYFIPADILNRDSGR